MPATEFLNVVDLENSLFSSRPGYASSDVNDCLRQPGASQLGQGGSDDHPRIALVVGTRPEVIKLSPVCRSFVANGADVSVVLTGQHRELVHELLEPLEIAEYVDIDLGIMTPRQKLNAIASVSIEGLGKYFEKVQPDAVIVQGDTTSAFCGALAAFHEGIPVGHVEAGLRSGVLRDPFPEELNRQIISRVCRWQFAPTSIAARNLEIEAIAADRIFLVGNTVVDSLHWVMQRGIGESKFEPGSFDRRVLVTLHRRETRGAHLRLLAESICKAAEDACAQLLFPIHPSPDVRDVVLPVIERYSFAQACEPLNYFDFIATLRDADIAVSDSGGVQEEAPTLRTPVLVVRNTTERPEALAAGCALLVGTDPECVESSVRDLFEDEDQRMAMASTGNPFGDGHAAERIASNVLRDIALSRQSAI